MRSFVAVGMGFCVLLAGAACPSARDPMPGGWSKVSVKGEGVVQAAQFAVKAQQEAMKADGKGEKIILVKILSAEHQVVAGSNYNLAISGNSGRHREDGRSHSLGPALAEARRAIQAHILEVHRREKDPKPAR